MPKGILFASNNLQIVKDGLRLYLDAALISSYPGSGTTWTDLSTTSNTTTLLNGPVYSAADGGKISFDGTNDYATTTNTVGSVSAWTISAWINKPNTQRCYILNNSGTVYFGLEIYETAVYANIGNNIYSETLYNINGWQHIVFVYDGSLTGNSNRLKVYINSVLGSSTYVGTVPSSQDPSSVFAIGRRHWTNGFSKFDISQLLMYNRALSASEVVQNYNAIRSRYAI